MFRATLTHVLSALQGARVEEEEGAGMLAVALPEASGERTRLENRLLARF